MKSRTLKLLAAALVAIAVGALGFRSWRDHVIRVRDESAFKAARRALEEHRATDALAIFQAQDHSRSPLPWGDIELAAYAGTRQLPRLIALYENSPDRVLRDEAASQLVARTFLHSRRPKDRARIREHWRTNGASADAAGWFALDADALFLEGKPKEALRLLQSRRFPGADDVPRLVRLALATAGKDLTTSWNHLADAARLDPRNTEVRSFRAQILEQIDKPELARVEYVAAHVADPRNPLLRDQLAEYYRRQGNLDLALTTWEAALPAPSLDYLWLKARFWQRMVRPPEGSAPGKVPPGSLAPLVEFLGDLEPSQFWDAADLKLPPGGRRFGRDRQEVFWLQLAGHLQARQDKAAFELLSFQRSANASWDPDLERALGRLLSFRLQRTLNPSGVSMPGSGRKLEDLPPYFRELETLARQERDGGRAWKPSPDTTTFLLGDSAEGAAFLAAGWREAALRLLPDSPAPGSPGWLDYGFAQALRYNRSPQKALDFISGRPASPSLDVLRAELLIATGRPEEGLRVLAPISTQDSAEGFRAAWLLAMADLERKNPPGARQRVTAQPRLAHSPTGVEILAKAALAEGSKNEASRLYRQIATQSVEARSFLAHEAFAQKDWDAARRWTTELIALMPDQLQLRENLEQIRRASATP
ncbi:MAG: hypothetical protein JNL10_12605 [Verrucomicrobiales bacterium]|nr:hypothetical protein [Verrucomicrobiales bacterium]